MTKSNARQRLYRTGADMQIESFDATLAARPGPSRVCVAAARARKSFDLPPRLDIEELQRVLPHQQK
jgi:hypothetical protein